ncbi:hypothetical protein CR156_03635 [Stenotrophomonas lactitubi]|uniref:hypothetical protein n=1 Tax=Stenotrophomonas lactitubi TaxID=2045214 RepID=UPI000C274547|nr:hypothetical protein [Stenotrophomonas lactitubi]PJO51353.1 hypothetical protein CR156_03635 [Stenotrophomonas lactitubi]
MTPEERIQQRKREELLKRANATPTASPTQEERLVSDGMKENLKAASHWAGVISRRTAELTQKGVAAAAEKAKEVKATVDAKRARSAEERVQATEAESGPTVQPTEAEVATKSLKGEDAGSLVVDGMAQDLVLVDGEVGEGKAPFAEMAAEDLVDALSAREPAAIAVEAEAVGVSETNLEPGVTEQRPVVEAARFAPEADAPSYQPADAVKEPQVTDDVSTGQGKLAATAAEELGPSPDAQAPEAAQASLHSTPRSRWPWVLAGVVAVALVVGAIYFLLGKSDQVPPSTPQPVAPVATPAAPEQLPEVVEAPVVVPAPAVLPEQAEPEPAIEKPEPVATPDVTASAPIATQPKPSPKRATAPLPRKAPAPAAEPRNDWQQKANADLDAWAKKSGID